MRKEFIVERQGRAFCLYAGLLDLAHQQGLKSIRTELIQAPSEGNNRVAICSATVILEQSGIEKQFTGIGDAAPNNVAPAMQTCLLRMAETRAKARALRDAVNIGVAAFEELGDEDAHDGAPERGYATAPPRQARPERTGTAPRSNGNGGASAPRANGNTDQANEASAAVRRPAVQTPPAADSVAEARSDGKTAAPDSATGAQIEAIRNLSRLKSVDPDAEARQRYSAESLATLTQTQASEMIRELNARPGSRTPAATG